MSPCRPSSQSTQRPAERGQIIANFSNPNICAEQSEQQGKCAKMWRRQRRDHILLHGEPMGIAQSLGDDKQTVVTQPSGAQEHALHFNVAYCVGGLLA